MSQREEFISSVLFSGKADRAQIKFASESVLKDISDEQLNGFALFALSMKTKYDNSIQMLLNAAKEYQKENYLKTIRATKPFQNIQSLRNFLNTYFKGKIVGSGIKPFIYTSIRLNDELQLVNENTQKPLNASDESEFLENLLKEQELIGIYRGDLIASRIKKRDEVVLETEVTEMEKIEAKAHHKDKQEIDEAWARLSEFGAKLSFIRRSIA
ncbi:Uncharacterised protein [Campylobacter hyointestinalis subsp. hyointestinalis]|uniref:Uncharacterized protein n=1 Tax=Campylobacter hyointestinalis subsp. hyointestinalis TaxID=91352 RepID=A0A9W5AVG4_CAMHY|nr:hypothetical protein [Campylobacter hyointestinalis]CUU77511.1 Uncharacterised protein [Campylobacter hyointestinalis subsp. hyointestinalis]CUU91365.1 Uncharacterised protein [Campylobacter hyointestinalis subsp. hyointestinalis]